MAYNKKYCFDISVIYVAMEIFNLTNICRQSYK